MGLIKHNTIIVTSQHYISSQIAHSKATDIFGCNVTQIIRSRFNGYYSFMIGPDGSKESWEESHFGDINRNLFFEWLKTRMFELHYTLEYLNDYVDCVEIRYGGDNYETEIVRINGEVAKDEN